MPRAASPKTALAGSSPSRSRSSAWLQQVLDLLDAGHVHLRRAGAGEGAALGDAGGVYEAAEVRRVAEHGVQAAQGVLQPQVAAREVRPLLRPAARRDAAARDVRDGELAVSAMPSTPTARGRRRRSGCSGRPAPARRRCRAARRRRPPPRRALPPRRASWRAGPRRRSRKCPEPQHGSSTVTSAAVSGQPSKVPAAGVPSSLRRRYSRSSVMGLSGWRAAHHAPRVLCRRNFTM